MGPDTDAAVLTLQVAAVAEDPKVATDFNRVGISELVTLLSTPSSVFISIDPSVQ